MHEGPPAFHFELAGDLDAIDAATLKHDWQTASPIRRNRTLIIDLSFVAGINEAVRSLVPAMARGESGVCRQFEVVARVGRVRHRTPVYA
jgi:hypothetical protein